MTRYIYSKMSDTNDIVFTPPSRLTAEERADYILKQKNIRAIIIGLIQDKYCFSDINDLVFKIATHKTLTDKQKISRITNLTEIYDSDNE